jgi:hypothetical protein
VTAHDGSVERATLEQHLIRALALLAVVAAAVTALAAVLGWTAAPPPSFDITPNPGLNLPF